MQVRENKFVILVFLLGSLTSFGPLSIDMYLPAFSQIAHEFQVPISSIQFSLTAFFLGLAIGQVFYGPFLDRFGRKPPIIFGLSVYVVASWICAHANDPNTLFVARFLQAIGACAGMVASRTVVRDLFNERQSAQVFSLLMLVMGAAPILAPLIGGYLATAFGWKSIFYILTGLSLLCLLTIIRVLGETRGPNPLMPLSSAFKNYLGIIKGRRFIGFAVAGSLSQAGMFAYITGSPFVLIELFKVPAENYGWVFGSNAFGLIAASQINARLLRDHTPEKILRSSFLVLGVSAAAILASVFFGFGLWAMLVPLFIFIGTLGLTLPNTTAAALAAEGARAGSASALLGTIQFSFAAISSVLVSSFDNGTAVPMAATIAGAGILALIVYSLTMSGLRKQEAK